MNFPRPNEPMGEAWFQGDDRVMFTTLLEQPIAEAPIELIENVLWEISSGISSFGHRREWHVWFKHLLPHLIIRGNQAHAFHALVESTVTAFMNVFWNGITEEYPGFGADVFDSLALCLMAPDVWVESSNNQLQRPHTYPLFLVGENDDGALEPLFWHAGKSNNQLSCMMFFGLKYLPTSKIPAWVSSLLAIENPYWKGAVLVWLLGAQDLLEEKIALASKIEKTSPSVKWNNSHVLGSRYGSIDAEEPPCAEFNDNKDFLPAQNNPLFLAEIKRQLMPEMLIQWTDAIATEPNLDGALLYTPDLLFDRLMR